MKVVVGGEDVAARQHVVTAGEVADIAAGLLLVREAGGFVSDLAGGQTMLTSGDVLAANDRLHLPLAALIRQALRSGRPAA